MKLLNIGTEVWTFEESITDRWLDHDAYHYEIVRGNIDRINHGGFTEYVVQTWNRLGKKSILRYLRTSQLGKTFWLTEAEAIEAAEKATVNHERRWHTELARPWRKNEEQII